MKFLFIFFLFFSSSLFADYSEHPEAQDIIETLVGEHGFDRSYVIQILKMAKNF